MYGYPYRSIQRCDLKHSGHVAHSETLPGIVTRLSTRDTWRIRRVPGNNMRGTHGALGGFRGNNTRGTRGALGGFRGNNTRGTHGSLGGFRGMLPVRTHGTRGASGDVP